MGLRLQKNRYNSSPHGIVICFFPQLEETFQRKYQLTLWLTETICLNQLWILHWKKHAITNPV